MNFNNEVEEATYLVEQMDDKKLEAMLGNIAQLQSIIKAEQKRRRKGKLMVVPPLGITTPEDKDV